MKNQSLIYLTSIFILSSCVAEKKAAQTNAMAPHPAEYAVLWHQTSGEYKALCHQAFYLAQRRLEEIRSGVDGEQYDNPAIIMDIDETVLDNSPYAAQLILNNTVYTDETWREWTGKAAAAFVPGAKEFLDYAVQRDFTIYFISNRSEIELENTVNNLRRLGFNTAPDYFLFKQDDRSKESRRRMVEEEHQVVLYIGDNLRDFSEIFNEINFTESADHFSDYIGNIGSKFIILPNAMYGEWLYNQDEDGGLSGDEVTPAGVQYRRSKIKGY